MKQKNWKTVEALLSLCIAEKIEVNDVVSKLASGELEYNEEKHELVIIEKKLTKPEQREKRMIDAAKEGLDYIMGDENLKGANLNAIKKIIFKRNPDIYIETPQLFGKHITNAVNNYDKNAGNDFTQPTATIKESEINPKLVDWAKEKGIKVTPLPEQEI